MTTIEEKVRGAKSAQEALLAIAEGVDAIESALARVPRWDEKPWGDRDGGEDESPTR